MKAEIVAVGTEILLGEITDTNSAYLASELPALGIDLFWVSGVGDNMGRIVEVLKRAWGRSDLILVTGGLGPTEDDITRESIAQMLGEELRVDPEVEKWLRGFFASRGISMPERNIKQATLIPAAQAIHNSRGTAPGWWVEREGRVLVAMPGVPAELMLMWPEQVVPRLKARLGGEVILSRTLKTFGMAEAAVDEALSPFLSSPNPSIGIYAKVDGIHVRLAAKAQGEEKARGMLREMESKVMGVVGERVWGTDSETLEGNVGKLLAAQGLTLAVMESCTGGHLSNLITDVPGSSSYFKGGLVAYTNEMKIAFGVPEELIKQYGAVSPPVAEAMARAARERLGVGVGVGITGVAGPDPLEGKPAGTVHIAIDLLGQRSNFSHNFRFPRLQVKRWTVLSTLFQLRRLLTARAGGG